MIIFFGPTGSGKSVQGQLMAIRHGWRWISAGQLLRDTSDPEIISFLKDGALVPDDYTNRLVFQQIDKALNIDGLDNIILDGYPRRVEQAKKLLEYGGKVQAVIVFDVDSGEIFDRLHLRGRIEDNPETIQKRIEQYNSETKPVIDFFEQNGVLIKKVNGAGRIDSVHNRIDNILAEVEMEREQ